MSDIGDDDYTLCDKKFAVVMVIDVSGSMHNEIGAMTHAFNEFIDASKKNDDVRNAVDIAILTFNSNVKDELNGFSDISGVPRMNFTAGGSTNMAEALRIAKDMARERTLLYNTSGIRAFKPWILLMTDGYPDSEGDYKAIAAEIRQREDAGKVRTFAVGMGDGYNAELLKALTDKCFALNDWDFSKFFSWLGKSFAIISSSTPGETTQICDLGEEFQDMYGTFFDKV